MQEILNHIFTELKKLNQGQTEIRRDIAGLQEGQKNLEQRQINLEQRQINLEQRQIKLEQRQINLEESQKKLEQGQFNLNEKLEAFQNQTMSRFNQVDKKLDSVYDAVADLMEFRTEVESRLKIIEAGNRA